jgi:hypothetical protein
MKNKFYISASCVFTLLALMSIAPFESFGQEVQASYFGHVGYTAKFDNDPSTRNQSAFNTGGVDILLTSQINDRLTAIGELFTGYRGDGASSVTLSIERLYFKYAVNDYFNVRLGRMYTPLGFWQSRYSQAQFFAPTINAPYPVRTKADKGIIPTNSVALQIDGENIGKLRLSYYFMIDNTTGAPSLNTDNTDFKAFTGKVKIEPIENLELFVSGRKDRIMAGGQSVQGLTVKENTDQTYFNLGVVHISQSSPLEAAFEYYNVENNASSAGTTKNNFMYAYLGYRINKITPYLQWDHLKFDDNDPSFTPNDLTGLVIGGRYSIAPTAIVKVEYKYRSTETLKHQDVISLQVSARF